jgi:hypothetical protein
VFSIYIGNDQAYELNGCLSKSQQDDEIGLIATSSLSESNVWGAQCDFGSLRAPRTRSLKGFLSDLCVLRGKKTMLAGFSDSLLDTGEFKTYL